MDLWFCARQFIMKDGIEYPEADTVPCSKIYISPNGCEISEQRATHEELG